jgi:mannose-6-phosphate isomerase-like protein (cupin superfamily)/DNA-directed RNA polymerase subunit RPC12/RpoP
MKKILLAASLLFAVLAAVRSQDQAATEPAKQPAIQTVNLNDIREFDKKDILKMSPLTTDKFVFNTFFFSPGQVLKLHKHPASDELFYIVEGRGQFTVGDNQVMVDSGSVIYGPAGVPHGLVNSGDTGIVMTSLQSPKPVKITYIEHAGAKCAVCGQENIIPANAKAGDIITCPRCHAKLKLSKDKDGNWLTTQV